MIERTEKEINEQIEKLKNLKKILPEENAFGVNNWEIIDYQIEILQYRIINDDEIMELGVDEMSESTLLDTIEWRDGNDIDPPVSEEDE